MLAALQRAIPHDIRIDYIPGSSFRDRMILFQDYYNADECFQILTQNTVFIGGDIRENDNWQIDPQFSSKFWFLSYNLYDDSFFKSHLGKVVRPYSSNERVQTNWQIF